MRDEAVAARLALEACRLGIPLDAQAYLAALACVRTPADLSTLVAGMSATPRLRWLRSYADAPVSSVLALAGTLGGTGRSLPTLQNATPAEVQAALQALAPSMQVLTMARALPTDSPPSARPQHASAHHGALSPHRYRQPSKRSP
jgi:hypothetical protein